MSTDPAFLFYPGDYLRDTQCLSESVQVAYDRIMCEHMRNICISQDRLNFFTKRLKEDEKIELKSVLGVMDGGFCIPWVHESLLKRRAYSESRSKNRKKSHDNHMKSHDNHMENANENVIEIELEVKLEQAFEQRWQKYPKKDGRKDALKHWKASIKSDKDLEDFDIALNNYLSSERVFNGFTKNGSTYFNGWKDWISYKEEVCPKCKGKGKYVSTTGYESVCSCPRGNKERIGKQ